MKLYTLDKREIRSFRLRQKTLELKNFFEKKDSYGLFMMSETLQPRERINKRKDYIKHNLQINNISKKVATFLSKKEDWKPIKNLLTGNVMLIKEKTNKAFSEETLNFILKEKSLSVRFLYWNENIYRNTDILRLIDKTENKNNAINLSIFIKQLALKQLITIQPFLKHNNPQGLQTLKEIILCDLL